MHATMGIQIIIVCVSNFVCIRERERDHNKRYFFIQAGLYAWSQLRGEMYKLPLKGGYPCNQNNNNYTPTSQLHTYTG
ncbi:MAG: hypothetical protein MJE68_16735, partial [Proteobacteria bacterium]|nr:hypothetical protein [Pseudomonadota bacterium]